MNCNADPLPAAAASGVGVVELREDVPLKSAAADAGRSHAAAAAAAAAAAGCAGGPRLVLACFAALSAAITLALFTQIYYGDFEVVPHGGVASDAAACSEAGTLALKEGGRAVDASVVTALCLAVLAPHRTSLDASGSLVYWEYRQARTQAPMLAEWGAAGPTPDPAPAGRTPDPAPAGRTPDPAPAGRTPDPAPAGRTPDPAPAGRTPDPAPAGRTPDSAPPPRLLAALASLHSQYGVLSWGRVLKPAIDFARNGFPVSESLAAALSDASAEPPPAPAPGTVSAPAPGTVSVQPRLAAYLESLQHNTSAQLSAAWSGVEVSSSAASPLGDRWRLVAGGRRAAAVRRALRAALQPPPAGAPDAEARVLAALQREETPPSGAGAGVATGLAVVDPFDTYVALVTGLSTAFGSGPATAAGWRRDAPATRLDLAPAILLDERVCGTRYVLGGAAGAALAQTAAALAAGAAGGEGDAAGGVERARASSAPVNVVRQRADDLLTHSDSRGGGLASRF